MESWYDRVPSYVHWLFVWVVERKSPQNGIDENEICRYPLAKDIHMLGTNRYLPDHTIGVNHSPGRADKDSRQLQSVRY
jgi:hypothetical protein